MSKSASFRVRLLLLALTVLFTTDCSGDDPEPRPEADSGTQGEDSGPVHPGDAQDAPFEMRASILGKLVSRDGAPITNATFKIYDERATGEPRSDVVTTMLPSGEFRLRLTTFPESGSEAARTPPHRLVVVIETPSTLPAYRVAHAHPGDAPNLGTIRLVGRDSRVTPIGPEGGTATDSSGRVEIVIPKGALATTTPIVITPFDDRADFPAPLPDATLTMYGFEAEPTGTTFAVPATVRVANARNIPTSLEVPIGSYDVVDNRWEHEGIATWDGARFAGPIRHFSTHDVNGSGGSDRLLLITKNGNPNQSAKRCGTGSAWRIGGGSVEQVFPLPGTRVRNEDFSLSLHYDSGLAASRKLGTKGTSETAGSGFAVTMPSVTVQSFCVARGAALPTATQPGQCISRAGSCGNGGVSYEGAVFFLNSQMMELRKTHDSSTDATFGGWVDLPLGEGGQLPSNGYVTETVSVMNAYAATGSGSGSGCASMGGTFAVPNPYAPRVDVPTSEGATLRATRKVLLHHRFTSPFGAGWAIREVSRLFTTGGQATLVAGDGQEEEFRPRARVTEYAGAASTRLLARDAATGEIFMGTNGGAIAKLDPATGARTDVLTGVAFPDPDGHAMAITYVGGVRHFVLAFASGVIDVTASGARRVIATRNPSIKVSGTLFGQSNVAARGSAVFYTTGDLTAPLLYRIDLAEAAPSAVPITVLHGDARLHPKAPLSGMELTHPLGLAFGDDGTLYVADAGRNAVYRVAPDASGGISGASAVSVAVGGAAPTYTLRPGEMQPAEDFPLNQPAALAMTSDAHLLVMTSYGVAAFDTIGRGRPPLSPS